MSCTRGCCETQREHYCSIQIAPSATPTRNGGQVQALNAKQKRWDRDIAAVNQMKKDKIVPRQVDGAAEWLAKADDKLEIERFQKFNNIEMVKEVQAELDTPKPMEEVRKIHQHNAKVLKDVI